MTTSSHADNILVVDDNAMNRTRLTRLLDHLNYQTKSAASGERALQLLRQSRFDLVLLDLIMPVMDGYEVLRQLKADDQLKHIPVIIISSMDDTESIVRCLKLGAEDHMPKWFEPVLLQARIEASLAKHKLRTQERDYLATVEQVTEAVMAYKANGEVPRLGAIVSRTDGLGELARMVQQMTQDVKTRQNALEQQVKTLRIEVDKAKQTQEVNAITATEYFQRLRSMAHHIRGKLDTD